jgi:iron complex outermembrane receptor protein
MDRFSKGKGSHRCVGGHLAIGICAAFAALPCSATSVENLGNLSLDELSNLEVTSVSKTAEVLRSAPATIYVITHDDIVRSGVTSIAEALRLAPNLQMTQLSATNYAAGARGFGGAQDAQNFSNKLLVLIDGRSVYSPLFSGVYLDVQDMLMDDIDRIEVISGPGATLWGANAMNGVINIITRPSYLTTEPLISAGVGNRERTVRGRYGAKLNNALSFRVYGKAFERGALELADASSAQDPWDKTQGGFRMDWTGANDSVTTQGDAYRAHDAQADGQSGLTNQKNVGDNILVRWEHRTDANAWQLQGYYDYTQRAQPPGGVAFGLRTFDIELQQRLTVERHRIVWGAGSRIHRYHITNSNLLLFEPNERTLVLNDVFLQDTIGLSQTLDLILGLKLERDPFSGWTPLPEARLAWHLNDTSLLWASAARAIRAPTPFDHDVVERMPGPNPILLTGDPAFQPEEVDAFEIGYRAQPLSALSLSASVFYNLYDHLRTVEGQFITTPSPSLFLHWDNLLQGNAYGLETWAKWVVTDWWRLSPGVRLLYKDLEFKSGATQLLGTSQAGNDPKMQTLLTSSMNLGSEITFDATFRYVGALPEPHLDAYGELQASMDWEAYPGLDVSLSGFNLLRPQHLEYPGGEYVPRSGIVQIRWRF